MTLIKAELIFFGMVVVLVALCFFIGWLTFEIIEDFCRNDF